ncbi:M55 family metallopeptidase [Streptacidiphilus cavernicola]|uniref:M55 family metallopeptidase n=1 Tax=Streptacidiphilus cavernicola TaxID=3342716 RepID=A0ABV6VRC7_9ACTN
MKVLISADMEGATGVTCPDDCAPGHARWEYNRRLLTGDVNAAVAGFAAAGATEILVNEAHADQRNLLLDQLDDRASLLIGTHKPLGMMEGIDRSPDAVAFIGYHTGAGQPGVLAHTYLPNTVTEVRIDGRPASEGRMNALLADEYGVPVVLVTGDDLCCQDAADWAPHAATAAVKTCVDRYSAVCLPPSRSAGLITAAARDGLTALAGRAAVGATAGPTAPPPGGYTYQVSFDAAHLAPAASYIPGVDQIDPLTVRYTLPTMYEAIRCFRAVTRVATSAVENCYG